MKQRKFISILVSASMVFNVLSATTGSVIFAAEEESDDLMATEETTEEVLEEDQAEVTEATEVQEAVEETSEEEILEEEAMDEEAPVEETEEEYIEETEEYVEESEEIEEAPELPTAFSDEAEAGGFIISVTADEGVFPNGSYMIVNTVEDAEADALVDDSRDDDVNVAYSMTFDITVYDIDGNEIEPDTAAGNVYVSFTASGIANNNLEVDVYHITDDAAVLLDADVYEDTVIAETDGFSYYTVEFTYDDMEYVLEGGTTVELSTVLDYVGLQGNVTYVEVSNSDLFSAYEEDGVWYVSANSAFLTDEWMKVTVDGIEYTIDVTDAATVAYYQRSSGYDVQGVNPTIQTTFSNAGYRTQMSVEGGSNLAFNSFDFGKEYSVSGVSANITATLNNAGNAVIVTYHITNTNEDAVSVRIGSSADTQVGDDDHADVHLVSNGITMRSSNGNEFYLLPGNGDFTTRWFGYYSNAYSNVFNSSTTYQGTSTDSGLAFSWTLIVPAGRTVTRTAVFTAGNNLQTYNITFNANGGSGTMSNATFISDVPGSVPECKYSKSGYTFMGWATSQARANAHTVDYADQGQITLTGNLTLYAVWLPSAVVVTPPTVATNLAYTGQPLQVFSNPGHCDGGTMQYSIDSVTWTDTPPTRTNAGTYTIWYKGHGDADHGDSVPVGVTVTIAKSNPVVTAPTAISNLTYNGTNQPAVNPGSTNGGTLQYSLDGTSWSTSIPTVKNAGDYTIYYRVLSDSNVNSTGASSFQFTVNKKNAVINANNITKTYGSADPALTVTYTGLASGTTSLNYTISREAGQNVGTYTITVTPGNNPNYNVAVAGGIFTITPKAITVSANNILKSYGSADPTLTADVTGKVGSDTINYTLSRAEGEDVGTYAITVTLGENPNYTVTATGATFTISPAQITISADSLSKTYGDEDPTLTATVTGTLGQAALDYTLTREVGEDAGTYVITVTLGENPNYTIDTANGTFTIERAQATVTADSLSKTYGDEDPTLTATVNGAIGDEVLDYTVSREEGENAGEYVITVTLGENPNYTIATEDGIFTIEQKEATVTAEDISKIYGGEDPELAATVDGTVGEEVLEYTIAREEGENAGEYVIAITLGDNPNYDITVVDGTFTIAPAQATVIAEDNSKIYGDEDPELVTIVTGTIGDEVLDYTVSREEGEDAGEYVIAITLGENPNYDITVEDATFTIEKADPVVTAPIGVEVDYTGDPQALFIPGTTTGGTLEYSFDGILYSTGILRGVSDGYYVILYRVAGDDNYNGTDPRYIIARINTVMVTVTFVDPTTGLPYGGTGTTGNGGTGTSGLPNGGYGTNGLPSGGTGTTGNGGFGTTGNGGFGTSGLPFGGTTGNGGSGTNGNDDLGPIGLPFGGIGTTGVGGFGTNGLPYDGTGTTGIGDLGTIGLPFGGTGTTGIGGLGAYGQPFGGSGTSNGSQGYAAAGHALTPPDDPTRYANDFTGWYVDEECTIPFDFDDPIGMNGATIYAGWAPVDYHLTEGADGTWEAGEEDGLTFRAVRNRLESTTFSHYTYVVVDGRVLGPNDYTARSGSVIIELSPEFLATLDVGEHELDIVFDDADSVITYFTIDAQVEAEKTEADAADTAAIAAIDIENQMDVASIAASSAIVSTGEKADNTNIVIALILLCASAVTSGFYIKRKAEENR